jgi:hypothetical protein
MRMFGDAALGALMLSVLLACKLSQESSGSGPTPTAAAAPIAPEPELPAVPAAPPSEPLERPAETERVGCPSCPPRMRGANLNTQPPTMDEWNEVGEITVRHSTPLRCETKMVREWLKVKCTGSDVLGVAFERSSGPWGNVPPHSRAGNANIVAAVRYGVSLRARFDWSWGSRVLSVDFPRGSPQPAIAFDGTRP